MRNTSDIMHNGVRLSEILRQHEKFTRGEKGGARANLAGANLARADLANANLAGANLADAYLAGANLAGAYLAGANLTRANLASAYLAGANLTRANLTRANLTRANLTRAYLTGAYLTGAYGNMREIKSAQFDRWDVAWITCPRRGPIVQIGCQRHTLKAWERAPNDVIARMDEFALDWWSQFKAPLLALINASPAVPHGRDDA